MHRGDANNDWQAVGGFLLLLGWGWGSGEHIVEERGPEQGPVLRPCIILRNVTEKVTFRIDLRSKVSTCIQEIWVGYPPDR